MHSDSKTAEACPICEQQIRSAAFSRFCSANCERVAYEIVALRRSWLSEDHLCAGRHRTGIRCTLMRHSGEHVAQGTGGKVLLSWSPYEDAPKHASHSDIDAVLRAAAAGTLVHGQDAEIARALEGEGLVTISRVKTTADRSQPASVFIAITPAGRRELGEEVAA